VHVDFERVQVVEPLKRNLTVSARAAMVVVVDRDAWRRHDAGSNVMNNGRLVGVGHISDVDLSA
jgi:hypothetical protein